MHKNILISGKVQGVYFRASAKHKADELGLTGFVSNTPDGKVYAEAEGDHAALEQFIAWCRKGPSAAIVKSVDVTSGPLKNYAGFIIQR